MSESKKRGMQLAPSIIIVLFLVILSCGTKIETAEEWVSGACYETNYENLDLKHLAGTANQDPYRVATVAYEIHPAFSNAYGLESADGYVVLYPYRYQEFWERVIEPLTLNDSYIRNYYSNWGNRIYLFAPSDDSFHQLTNISFSDYYNLDLLSLANVRYLISTKPLISENLILQPSQMPEHSGPFDQGKITEGLADNLQGRRLFIYKNNDCLPRFFVVQKTKLFENTTQLLDSLSHADIGTLRSTAFVENNSFPMSRIESLGFADGNIEIKKYSPDRIDLDIRLNGSGILLATNSHSPYWECFVDGVNRDVFPVDGTFCGVYLQGGEMNVTLKYDPPYRSFY